MTTTSIRLDAQLIEYARAQARASIRTTPKQIEYWARIGSIALEHPEMSIKAIEDSLESLEESRAEKSQPFVYK